MFQMLSSVKYCTRRLLFCPSNFLELSTVCTLHYPHLQFLRESSSSTAVDEKKQSFIVSYLVNSCGLCPKRAHFIYLSYKLKFDSPEKPDAVLSLLSNYGFTDLQVSKLLNVCPSLISCRLPILLSKLSFLGSIGFPGEDLPDFIIRNPLVLRRSLQNFTIPLYKFLKSVLRSDAKTVTTLKRSGWCLQSGYAKNLFPNVALLRETGVPPSKIGSLLHLFPRVLFIDHVEFRGTVDEVVRLGFNASKVTFVLAIHASWNMFKVTRDSCVKAYKCWGWSDADISLAFQKYPLCLLLSEKKLTGTLDFLVNKMGYPVGEIARIPIVLGFSFERRIKPRCSVVKVLLSKGLIEKNPVLNYVLHCPEKLFLGRFVTRYQEISAELLGVYRGEVSLSRYA